MSLKVKILFFGLLLQMLEGIVGDYLVSNPYFGYYTAEYSYYECVSGYARNENGDCEDVNECEYENECSYHEKCHNNFGSYSCIKMVCDDGYELIDDEAFTCARKSDYCIKEKLQETQCNDIPKLIFHSYVSITNNYLKQSGDPELAKIKIQRSQYSKTAAVYFHQTHVGDSNVVKATKENFQYALNSDYVTLLLKEEIEGPQTVEFFIFIISKKNGKRVSMNEHRIKIYVSKYDF